MWLQAAEMVDKALQREYGDMRGYGGAQALVELAGQFRARAAAPAPAGDGNAVVVRLKAACTSACQYEDPRDCCLYCEAARALTAAPTQPVYDSAAGDDRPCSCGHPYYRHFDTYENMASVGCKYCGCQTFTAAPGDGPADLVALVLEWQAAEQLPPAPLGSGTWKAAVERMKLAHRALLAWTPAASAPTASFPSAPSPACSAAHPRGPMAYNCVACGKPIAPATPPTRPSDNVLCCLDCGLAYRDFPLDTTLPDEQWLAINNGDPGKVLCASCIVRRGATRLPRVIALRAHFEQAEQP